MRRRPLVALLALGASACLGQQAPERGTLPAIDDVISPPRPCSFTLGQPSGVRVESLQTGSTSEGVLEPQDRLISVESHPIASVADLREALADKAPGEAVAIEIDRGGDALTVTVELAANPSDPTVPRLGITVSSAFEETPVTDVTVDGVGGPLSRLVQVGDRVFRLDPLVPEASRLEIDIPDSQFWHAVDGVAYWVDDPTGTPALRGSDDRLIEAWEANARPARVLGGIEDDVIVVFVDDDGVSVRRVDVSAPEVEWTSRPNPDIGLPVVTYASSDGELLVMALGTPESEELRFLVLDASSGAILAELTDLAGAVTFGWFDDDRLVTQRQAQALELVSVSTGERQSIELPVVPTESVRLWPVGDGRHLLVQSEGRLLRAEVGAPDLIRTLVTRCEIGVVGQPGSGA